MIRLHRDNYFLLFLRDCSFYLNPFYKIIGYYSFQVLHPFSIDYYIFKRHVLHGSFFVQSLNQRWIFSYACICNISESNAFNAASRLFIIFLVETYFYIKQSSFLNILYPDIFEKNITNLILITTIHCHATLINRVILVMFQDVDVTESQILYHFSCR